MFGIRHHVQRMAHICTKGQKWSPGRVYSSEEALWLLSQMAAHFCCGIVRKVMLSISICEDMVDWATLPLKM